MKRRLLREEFNFKGGYYITKTQDKKKIVIIDPELSQSTVKYKDQIQKKFGASWISALKTWGWWVDKNTNETIKNKVKPCVKFLLSIETTSRPQLRNVDAIVKEILKGIDEFQTIEPSKTEAPKTVETLQSRVNDLAERFRNGLDNEATRKFVQDIIRYRNELKKRDTGYPYGFFNTMLVLVTKPDATRVLPTKEWEKMGYEPTKTATPIVLVGYQQKSMSLSKAEKAKRISDYLQRCGVDTIEELEPSARYHLENRVLRGHAYTNDAGHHFSFVVYDEKDVQPTREDAEKMPEEGENWWYAKIPADTKDDILTRAAIKFGGSVEGGSLVYKIVDSLKSLNDPSNVRGNACETGDINIVKDEHSGVLFPTAVHELTHQLRHWERASKNNPKLKKFYRRDTQRDMREFEAELSAAFVSDYFGYPIQHEFNYLSSAGWEISKEQVQTVLESVAQLSDYILNGIINNIEEEPQENA